MRKKKNTKFRAVDLLIILLCLAGSIASGSAFWKEYTRTLTKLNEEPVGTIVFKKRTAQRKFNDRLVWDRLRQTSPVYNGDTIRTIELSEAIITFRDEAAHIALNENTMIQIFYNEIDGVRIDLAGGSLEVISVSGSVLITGGVDEIVVEGRANLEKNKEGLSFSVLEGTASFKGERIQPGQAIVMDQAGGISRDPAIAVTSFGSSARFLGVPGETFPVTFTWNPSNFTPTTHVIVQVAADSAFTRVVETRDVNTDAVSIPLENGTYWWRAYPAKQGSREPVNARYPSGTLAVVPAVSVILLSPAPSAEFSVAAPTAIPFSWSAVEGASSYLLEISSNANMSAPVVSRHVQETNVTQSGLESGRWYWRITPVFPVWVSGSGFPSAARNFSLGQVSPALAGPPAEPPKLAEEPAEPEPTEEPEPEPPAVVPPPRPPARPPAPRPPPPRPQPRPAVSPPTPPVPPPVAVLPPPPPVPVVEPAVLPAPIAAVPEPVAVVPDDSVVWQEDGHRYLAVNQSMTWDEANAYAKARGGHLATITSREKQEFIFDLLLKNGKMNNYWLGAYREGRNWQWVTGEPFAYTNWLRSQPDNSGGIEDKLAIVFILHDEARRLGGRRGQWNDNSNNNWHWGNYGCIIEWDTSAVPSQTPVSGEEPATEEPPPIKILPITNPGVLYGNY